MQLYIILCFVTFSCFGKATANFPGMGDLAGMALMNVVEYEKTNIGAGYGMFYVTNSHHATFNFYTGNRLNNNNIPDGMSFLVQKELARCVAEVKTGVMLGKYAECSNLVSSNYSMGKYVWTVAGFKLKGLDGKLLFSEIAITGQKNYFVRLRYTCPWDERNVVALRVPKLLSAFRLGQEFDALYTKEEAIKELAIVRRSVELVVGPGREALSWLDIYAEKSQLFLILIDTPWVKDARDAGVDKHIISALYCSYIAELVELAIVTNAKAGLFKSCYNKIKQRSHVTVRALELYFAGQTTDLTQ